MVSILITSRTETAASVYSKVSSGNKKMSKFVFFSIGLHYAFSQTTVETMAYFLRWRKGLPWNFSLSDPLEKKLYGQSLKVYNRNIYISTIHPPPAHIHIHTVPRVPLKEFTYYCLLN